MSRRRDREDFEPMNIYTNRIPEERFCGNGVDLRDLMLLLRTESRLANNILPEEVTAADFLPESASSCEETTITLTSGPFYAPINGLLTISVENPRARARLAQVRVYNLGVSPKMPLLKKSVWTPGDSCGTVTLEIPCATAHALEIRVSGGFYPSAQMLRGETAIPVLLAHDFIQASGRF